MMATVLLSATLGSSPLTVNNIVPEAGDFRVQTIRKAQGEADWPFTADEGYLMCAPSMGQKLVYFVPKNAEGENEYPINIDTNFMAMAIINVGRSDAFRAYANYEDLIKRLSPYVTMGKRLCDQPAGTVIPESSL